MSHYFPNKDFFKNFFSSEYSLNILKVKMNILAQVREKLKGRLELDVVPVCLTSLDSFSSHVPQDGRVAPIAGSQDM